MDEPIRRALMQAAARAIFGMGVFLLVAAAWGYINASAHPGQDRDTQLTMVLIGVALAVAGRVLRARTA